MWDEVTDTIKRRGSIWTTHDERPGPDDRLEIARVVAEHDYDTFVLGCRGQSFDRLRIDSDTPIRLSYIESVGFWPPESSPDFCPQKMAAFLDALPEGKFRWSDIEHITGDTNQSNYFLHEARDRGWVESAGYGFWRATYRDA